MVRACPILTNGGSTGLAPIHVNKTTKETNTQNTTFFDGSNFLLSLLVFTTRTSNTRIAATIANTPPNFDGIDRRIA